MKKVPKLRSMRRPPYTPPPLGQPQQYRVPRTMRATRLAVSNLQVQVAMTAFWYRSLSKTTWKAQRRKAMQDARRKRAEEKKMTRYYILPRTQRRLEAMRRLGAKIRVRWWFDEDNDIWVIGRFVFLASVIFLSIVYTIVAIRGTL